MYNMCVSFSLLFYNITQYVHWCLALFCLAHLVILTQFAFMLFLIFMFLCHFKPSFTKNSINLYIYSYNFLSRNFCSLTYCHFERSNTLSQKWRKRELKIYLAISGNYLKNVLIDQLKLIVWISISRHCYADLEIYCVCSNVNANLFYLYRHYSMRRHRSWQ